MHPWDGFTLGASAGISNLFDETVSDGSVLRYCQRIAEQSGIGFCIRMGTDGSGARSLIFLCYARGEEPVAKYSSAFGNMGGEKYTESAKNYYNVAVVAGAGQGDSRITVTVGDTDASGKSRRELYVDARNLQLYEGETEADYVKRLEKYGLEKLESMKPARFSEFTLTDGGIHIGDPVYVIPSYIGEAFVTRVTSCSIKVQNNKIVRSIGAGTPISTGRR
jgi:hypothetical protein